MPCIVSNVADALVDRRFVDELRGDPSPLELWRDPLHPGSYCGKRHLASAVQLRFETIYGPTLPLSPSA